MPIASSPSTASPNSKAARSPSAPARLSQSPTPPSAPHWSAQANAWCDGGGRGLRGERRFGEACQDRAALLVERGDPALQRIRLIKQEARHRQIVLCLEPLLLAVEFGETGARRREFRAFGQLASSTILPAWARDK